MQWSNQVWVKPIFRAMVLFSPLLFVIGFYRNISFLFLLGLIIMFLYGATLLQFKSASRELMIDQAKQVYRLFPGDSDEFYVKLLHKGKWPSFRGELIFTHRDVISEKNIQDVNQGSKGRIELKRPFAIYRRTAFTQVVPFVALRRGTTRISNVTLQIHDPLQISGQSLGYQNLFPVEIIVYPKPHPVHRIEHLFHEGSGESARPFALFENASLPAGNREYSFGDAFHKLHWKATARTGTLQTKVFEKTVVYHWTFVYTILPDHKDMKSSEAMEREISYLAYMCQFAAEKGIPFEVYINFKLPGPLGMYHVPTGSGALHLSRILEGLARIDRSNVTVRPIIMWTKMDRNFAGSVPFIILLGHIPNDSNTHFTTKRWIRSGGKIFIVKQDGNEAYLMPYTSLEVVPC
ncbi:DUF58 domain-containing protein [Fictibacillus barbaricus]|uniref:DUF58 domain-containing protein n=1 Tax=Fictibacillus barbaricus TaxID=182136 RepID=A0ABS2Z918_9BACL|nr:DUF58 domain-containing protein [Fictibacillus barbaricus]MBN3544657.1 DUF58 domain-containing protein [Fictibacillus barbaricus]GGB64995.1 hypothetical protein GCM10007199_34000 [Fictibacillus barbaricus]